MPLPLPPPQMDLYEELPGGEIQEDLYEDLPGNALFDEPGGSGYHAYQGGMPTDDAPPPLPSNPIPQVRCCKCVARAVCVII